ncbi:hypothetical protein EVJ58_g28 [Rhodofomes roseus]|uniref:Uncharacterized protein n=1 Tax=Rhodofomes roseus TaxID=34475 RepID=A0A4Y9Z7G2_9APHY|nr:hypothetical protein EVJ58_g28 [Rhodofomes roseus]
MGPDHNAIVLSDSEPERRRTISETMALNEDLRAELDGQRQESELATLREGRAAVDAAGPRTTGASGYTPPQIQPQARRTSTQTSTAPLRFGPRPEFGRVTSQPRPESSTGQSRPVPRRPLLETHLRSPREGSSSTDSSTTLGRRVAARAAAGQSSGSRPSTSFNDIMDDIRRETRDMPAILERIRRLESSVPNVGERDAHWISQQNTSINNLMQEARALGVPTHSEAPTPTAGQRSAERTDPIDFPSPMSSSWFTPSPTFLPNTHISTSTTTTDRPRSLADHFGPPQLGSIQRRGSDPDVPPSFRERIAQLDAELEQQRERQVRLLARMSASQDASVSARDEAAATRWPVVTSDSPLNTEILAMEARLSDALETLNSVSGPGSSFETLRALTARDSASSSNNIEDDDPFSWLMPSRTPPAREAETRRTGRSVWPTTRDGASQSTNTYPFSETMAVFSGGRARRERGAQRTVLPPSGRGEAASSNASSSRRRRRGWARLDHDGNEIPTDEEEEYERNRAQMRARALQITASQPPERLTLTRSPPTVLPPPPPPAGRRLSFVPTTQPLFWPSSSSDVRVRINPARDLVPSELDRPITPHDDSDDEDYWRDAPPCPQTIGSSAPFVPSLLPLPRVDLPGSSSARAAKLKRPIRIADPMPMYCAGR